MCRKRYERKMINDPRARFIAAMVRGENGEKKSETNNEELRSNFRGRPRDKNQSFSILKARRMKE